MLRLASTVIQLEWLRIDLYANEKIYTGESYYCDKYQITIQGWQV